MDTRTLTEYSGLIGIIGGGFTSVTNLALWHRITSASNNSPSTEASVQTVEFMAQRHAPLLVGIAIINITVVIFLLVMGVLSLKKYNALENVHKSPPIIFIVASGLFFIPFIGKLISGILAIIGGVLFLSNLNRLE